MLHAADGAQSLAGPPGANHCDGATRGTEPPGPRLVPLPWEAVAEHRHGSTLLAVRSWPTAAVGRGTVKAASMSKRGTCSELCNHLAATASNLAASVED